MVIDKQQLLNMARFFFIPLGRVSRVPYALAVLFPALAIMAGFSFKMGDIAFSFQAVPMPLALLIAYPMTVIAYKRVHDLGIAAWPSLLLFPLIVYSQGVVFSYPDLPTLPILLLICTGLALIPGTKGANRYGPSPLDPDRGMTDVF